MGIEPTTEVWGRARGPSPPSETGNNNTFAARCLARHQPQSNELERQASYLVVFRFRASASEGTLMPNRERLL